MFRTNAEPPARDYSQTLREFEIRTWSAEHGMPSGAVLSTYQTKDGYLWVITQNALARFDGTRFVAYDRGNTPLLAPGRTLCVSEDADQRLWIGSTAEGTIVKEGNTFKRITPVEPHAQTTTFCLLPDGGRGMWVAGQRRWPMVKRYVDEKPVTAFTLHNQHPGLSFETIGLDETGRLWLGGLLCLRVVNTNGVELTNFAIPEPFNKLSATAVCRTRTSAMWVSFMSYGPERPDGPEGFRSWLACYKDEKWIRTPDPKNVEVTNYIKSIVEDTRGVLWMAGSAGRVLRYKAGQLEYLPVVPPGPLEGTGGVHCDREGNLWVSGPGNSLKRLTPRRITCLTTNEGLVHDDAWCVSEAADGSVWIGTEGGLSRWKDGVFENYPMPPDEPESSVRTITQDVDGRIWFGTIRALHSINQGKIETVKFPGVWINSKIRAVHPSRLGGLWVGTVRGLIRLQGSERTTYTITNGLPANEIRALLETRDGSLWVGTYCGGLSRLREGQFTNLGTTNGLSNDSVMSLYEDAQGVLWAGTEHGLNRIEGNSIRVFLPEHGLPDRSIHSIVEDDQGRLWMSCDHGVFWGWKRDFDTGHSPGLKTVRCVAYDITDGVPQDETSGHTCQPAGCRTKDGRLWFATAKGVVIADPRLVSLDEAPPLAAVERVQANGRLIAGSTPDDVAQARSQAAAIDRSPAGTNDPAPVLPVPQAPLKLAPGTARVLEFQYTANTFIAPEKARFKYRLLGLNDAWTDAGNRRQAFFTDLKPGNYRFEVIACNHRGVWQERGDIVSFTLVPFYYETWWFYILVGLVSVGSVAGLVTWRVRELRRIHELERVNALNEQRKRIARDIHDELGASLTHIVQLSGRAEGSGNGNEEKSGAPSSRIASIAGEAVDHINEIVWANNPEYDTLVDLVAYLREYTATFFEPSGVEVRFEFPGEISESNVTGLFRRGVLLIVKEALHNVLKHSHATQVRFRLVLHPERLEICITDNGLGFVVGEGRRFGNGLGSMRSRVEELQGTLAIRSAPGQGTTIDVSVPLQSSPLRHH
jgi:ligand-binding sensor domain-containing protein/signal transduction histidine kinase